MWAVGSGFACKSKRRAARRRDRSAIPTRARRRSPDLAETADRRSPCPSKLFGDSGDLRSSKVRGRRPAHSAFTLSTAQPTRFPIAVLQRNTRCVTSRVFRGAPCIALQCGYGAHNRDSRDVARSGENLLRWKLYVANSRRIYRPVRFSRNPVPAFHSCASYGPRFGAVG